MLLLLAALLCGEPPACVDDAAVSAAVAERHDLLVDGDLTEHAAVLENLTSWLPNQDGMPVVTLVRDVAIQEERARLFSGAGATSAAKAVLEAAKAKARAAGLDALVGRLDLDQAVLDRIVAAEASVAKESWTEARWQLRQVLDDAALPRIAGPARIDALRAALVTTDEKTHTTPSLPSWLGPTSMVSLSTMFGLLVLLFVVRRRDEARGRETHDVRITDPATPDAQQNALVAQLLGELRLLSLPVRSAAPAEALGDNRDVLVATPPPVLDELGRQANALIDETATLTIGAVKVPVRRLFDWVSRKVVPPRHTWVGTLSRTHDATLLTLEREERGVGARPSMHVRVTGTDDNARSMAIRELAVRLALIPRSDPAALPQEKSVVAVLRYREAIPLVESGEQGKLETARGLLAQALAMDPGLTGARLALVDVARRKGDLALVEASLEQLEASKALPAHEIAFRRALVEAGSTNYLTLRQALQRLEGGVLPAKELTPESRASARSLRVVLACELLLRMRSDARALPHMAEQERFETLVEEDLATFAQEPEAIDRAVFANAQALALAARGRLLNRLNDHKAAKPYFTRALALLPDHVPALVGLARAERGYAANKKEQAPEEWQRRARTLLDRAVALAPESDDVHFERARLWMMSEPPDLAQAEKTLRQLAGRHPGACFRVGELLAKQETMAAVGAEWMWRSVTMRANAPEGGRAATAAVVALQAEPAAVHLAMEIVEWLEEQVATLARPLESETPETKQERESRHHRARMDLKRTRGPLKGALEAARGTPNEDRMRAALERVERATDAQTL